MKLTRSSIIVTYIGFVLFTGMLTGCSGKPGNRKKMLNANSQDFWEDPSFAGTSDVPFYTGDIDWQSGGITRPFVVVALPDPAYDSLATSMVLSHALLAVPLLTEWAAQEKKGVLIDLRSSPSQDTRQEEYVIERATAFTIPVVFLWDRLSSARAASFIDLLQSLPSVHCRHIDGSYNKDRPDCFPAASPCIGCR